jgi:hypothetical protein
LQVAEYFLSSFHSSHSTYKLDSQGNSSTVKYV